MRAVRASETCVRPSENATILKMSAIWSKIVLKTEAERLPGRRNEIMRGGKSFELFADEK